MGYVILQMAQRKTWDPERMRAVIEAIRNKEKHEKFPTSSSRYFS
jgi:hypothetical protein